MRHLLLPLAVLALALGLVACGESASTAGSNASSGSSGAPTLVEDNTTTKPYASNGGQATDGAQGAAGDAGAEAVCLCDKGKDGEAVWCTACKKGYVDGDEVCCPKCVQRAVDKAKAAGGTE